MKRKFFSISLTISLLMSALLLFTGCEDAQPAKLVKANLDFLATGEITDDILSLTEQSEDDLKKLYEKDRNSSVNGIIESLDCKPYATEKNRKTVESFVTKAMSKTKYEVSEEYKEKDGIYSVDVTVYPMDFLQKANDYFDNDFQKKWKKKISSGEYTYTTEDQFMVDLYDDMFAYMSKKIDGTGYLEPVKLTVAVEKTKKDGSDEEYYTPNEDDLGKVGAAMIGQQ